MTLALVSACAVFLHTSQTLSTGHHPASHRHTALHMAALAVAGSVLGICLEAASEPLADHSVVWTVLAGFALLGVNQLASKTAWAPDARVIAIACLATPWLLETPWVAALKALILVIGMWLLHLAMLETARRTTNWSIASIPLLLAFTAVNEQIFTRLPSLL